MRHCLPNENYKTKKINNISKDFSKEGAFEDPSFTQKDTSETFSEKNSFAGIGRGQRKNRMEKGKAGILERPFSKDFS